MQGSTLNEQHAVWVRVATWVLATAVVVAFAAAVAGPAAAIDFEVGELRGHVDTTISAGASVRVQQQDCNLIHVTNGGCAEEQVFLNADDGNLNYNKWDIFANTYKATVDVDLAWRNYGAFVRGSAFYDLVTMTTDTRRTPLSREALYTSSAIESGVVGMGYQLLDAYVYGNYDVANRPLEIRVGNQVLSWGESLFYQGGVSAINTVDLNRLRAPGSQLKEAFLPAPIVRVSAELFQNFSVEGFYQLDWNYTQLDPVGSYFSSNDILGKGAEGLMALYDPGIEDGNFIHVARQLAEEPEPTPVDKEVMQAALVTGDLPPEALVEAPHLIFTDADGQVVKAKPGDFPRSAEEMAANYYNAVAPFRYELFPTGDDVQQDGIITFLNQQGIFPTALTRIGQLPPFTIPRLSDERAGSQGQWGMALRYFADAIRSEFGAYYIRIHDKVPSVGYVVEPADLVIGTYINAEEWGPFANATAAQVGGFGWRLADTRLASAAVPVGYFAEYPEGINIFGLTAATELFGIAWGAEVSYQTRRPVPVDGELTLRNLILEVTETGQPTRRSGFTREERWQAQLNAIATIGPGDAYVGAIVRALRISSIAATLEVALVKFPSLDSDIFYQPLNNGDQVDDLSWGYQTLIQGFYDNPFGVPVTVVPRIGFSHDVYGNTPGFYPFIEARKSFSAGVNLDYLGVWQFDLSYTNSFGAAGANMTNDRDFVSASVTYSF